MKRQNVETPQRRKLFGLRLALGSVDALRIFCTVAVPVALLAGGFLYGLAQAQERDPASMGSDRGQGGSKMGAGRNQRFVEDWRQIILGTIESGDEYFSDPIPVGEITDDLGEPCAGVEWYVILYATVNDVNLRMYTAAKVPPATTYVRSQEEELLRVLDCGGVSTYRQCDKLPEADVGGAVVFSLQRTGVEVIAVSLWARRYRYD